MPGLSQFSCQSVTFGLLLLSERLGFSVCGIQFLILVFESFDFDLSLVDSTVTV